MGQHCHAVLCLSRSRAVSKRSESLCCWHASLFFSPLYCCLSSLKRLLYLWTRSWRHHLSSKSSIVSWPQAHQEGCMYVCLFVTGLWLKYTSFTYSLRTLQHVLFSMVPMIRHRLLLSTQRSICLSYYRESQFLVKKGKRITVEPSNRRIKAWRRDRLASFPERETAWYQRFVHAQSFPGKPTNSFMLGNCQ